MITIDAVRAMDAADPLAQFKSRFFLPDGLVYLDGNSLGAAPHAALADIRTAAEVEWAQGLIESWNKAGWFTLVDQLGDVIGQLTGAAPGEVIVTDNTSANLFKTVFAGLSLRPDRNVIVAEGHSFPTDLYMLQGVASVQPRIDIRLEKESGPPIEDLLDDDVAVVLINHIDYRTGEIRDMKRLTALAHDAGAIIVWDLCHSAGVYPVELNACNVDLAVGCTYKYLNGGPGAPAFCFAAQRHSDSLTQPLSGWWGHARPFAFEPDFAPAAGVRQFAGGTQPILSLRGLKAGLETAASADMGDVRQKSVALTSLFIELVEQRCPASGLTLIGPRNSEQRGSHVCFAHEQGYAIVQALISEQVVGDFRRPDFMRFGFAPLYVSYEDVWLAVDRLASILENRTWDQPQFKAVSAVT